MNSQNPQDIKQHWLAVDTVTVWSRLIRLEIDFNKKLQELAAIRDELSRISAEIEPRVEDE